MGGTDTKSNNEEKKSKVLKTQIVKGDTNYNDQHYGRLLAAGCSVIK